MTDKLKSCPFCGGEVKLVTDFSQNKDNVYCFECEDCGVLVYMDDLNDKDKSIKAWNTRTNPWHTGTPTEEGWYLLATKNKNYVSYKATEIKSEAHLALVKEIIKPYKIVAWMPVPPFEASKDRE